MRRRSRTSSQGRISCGAGAGRQTKVIVALEEPLVRPKMGEPVGVGVEVEVVQVETGSSVPRGSAPVDVVRPQRRGRGVRIRVGEEIPGAVPATDGCSGTAEQ